MSALTVLCLLSFSLAVTLCTPLPDQQVELEQRSCPMFWYSFNGRCYKYIATRTAWADAELHCVNEGANLASIRSQEENQFVARLIKNFDTAQDWTWIGLTDIHKEGRWMWSDRSKVHFTLWAKGEPNGGTRHNCVDFNGLWADQSCSTTRPFVCASRGV